MGKRIKTKYPGVYYRETTRADGVDTERIYYVVFKKDGRTIEEKVGKQYQDDMTPARASGIRLARMEGRQKSRKQIRQEKEAARRAEDEKWTISRIWEEYSSQRAQNKGLAVDANRFTNYLAKPFGNKTPDEIITLDVDRVRMKMLKEKSPQTTKHVMALLKRIINFGTKRGLCPLPEPSKLHIELPRVDNKKTEDLTPDQLKSLLDAITAYPNRQVANLMKLALFTGMRRGELFRLKWEHIDFQRGFLRIVTPKGGVEQSIPLSEAALNVLLEHERPYDSPYVFPGRNGEQRKNINHQTNHIKKAAGLPKDFRPLHGLRHVYASMLASSGKVDMYTLQTLLTHKSPLMTQRYAHLRDETLKKASSVVDDLLQEVVKDDESGKVVNFPVEGE